jgi:nucleotide-binding universal stress UspA family protein
MYKTIVVGTDGSPSAGQAVAHAAELAKAFDATLHLVHAYLPPTATLAGSGVLPINPTDLLEGAADHGESICSEAALEAQKICPKVERHVVPADAAEAIIGTAESVGADLIVVGNRGMAGVKRFLLGSVPNRVAHHSPCHVMILHTT